MSDLTLIIGYKNYSSWSLRAWLALKQTGATFEERLIPFYEPDAAEALAALSPTRKVPTLKHGAVTVWESLAILEYLAELFPDAGLWPDDVEARAAARAVSSEMHAGFGAIRSKLPMNLRRSVPARDRGPELAVEVERVAAIWRDCRERFGDGGPFLFGRFGNADAMFAPVVTRFATYGIRPDATAQAYMEAVLGLPAMREWHEAARAEPWTVPAYEVD